MNLLFLAFVISASALRFGKPPQVNDAESPIELDHGLRPSRELPQKFEKKWQAESNYKPIEKLEDSGASSWSPHGDTVKLVVGIPVMTNQQDVVNAHLNTWVKGEGVCKIESYADPLCHVFPLFLYGNSSEAVHKAQENAFSLSLPVTEPSPADSGYAGDSHQKSGCRPAYKCLDDDAQLALFAKPYEWFKHASESYKWATHIGKMDADTYPHFKLIANDLATGPSKNVYWGNAMGGKTCNKGFMQGAIYIISADLQPCRQKHIDDMHADFYGEKAWKANEDGFFGNSMYGAVASGKCPQPTCLYAVQRFEHPV